MPWKPDYISADDLADFHRVDDDVDDINYAECATTASRAVDNTTHRQFGRTASEARFYDLTWSQSRGMWLIKVDDYVVLTEVAVYDSTGTWVVIDPAKVLKLDPNDAAKGRPYTEIGIRAADMPALMWPEFALRATAEWGWASVPVAIQLATKLQGSRLAARRDSPYGVAGSPENGSELRLLARLDPDLVTSIKDYIRKLLP